MSMAADLRTKIRSGQLVIGTWLTVPHYMVAETVAQGNFDFLLLDGEHAPVPPDTIGELLPATDLRHSPVLYRVRANSEDLIKGAVDAGVAGVWVPFINSRAEAERVVQAVKYPPVGHRGFGPWRASNYYLDVARYVAEANAEMSIALQIESVEAVGNIDAIAAVAEVDLLFIGPNDLAGSMGLPFGRPHPDVLAACRKVSVAAKSAKKAVGIDVASLDDVPVYVELGFSVFTYSGDTNYLIEGARAASQAFRDTAARATKHKRGA